jgi:hypothetical protein
MIRRLTPTTNNKTSAPKPAGANNYDRLLVILECNAAEAREPELIARLRETLARLRAATDTRAER